MSDYSQPYFYRFNEDSTLLIRFIQKHHQSARAILDLGAGSGILGIELANHFNARITLLELQKDFLPHLELNLKENLKDQKSEIFQGSFGSFIPQTQYDLIVSNPPYYLKGEGQESKDSRRGMARSFQHEGWRELMDCIERSLSPDGKAFIIIKNHTQIKKEFEKYSNNLNSKIHEIKDVLILELTGLDKN